MRAILPWMVKYALTAPKISRLQMPVVDYLKRYTQNQSLLDIISQHFFQETPAFFALSYLKLYLEYHYPLGGTGKIVEKLVAFIENHGGNDQHEYRDPSVDPNRKMVTDARGESHVVPPVGLGGRPESVLPLHRFGKHCGSRVRNALSIAAL